MRPRPSRKVSRPAIWSPGTGYIRADQTKAGEDTAIHCSACTGIQAPSGAVRIRPFWQRWAFVMIGFPRTEARRSHR